MHTVRRFLVTILIPGLIVSIFAVGAAAAHGPEGKVNLCHWADHKFVEISVSMNAKPAHMEHGDVDPDEYGDCSGDHEGDHEGDHDGQDSDSDDDDGGRDKDSHDFQGWGSSGTGAGGSERPSGHGDRD